MAHNYGQVKTPAVYLDFTNYWIHCGGVLVQPYPGNEFIPTHSPVFTSKFGYLDPYSLETLKSSIADPSSAADGYILGYGFAEADTFIDNQSEADDFNTYGFSNAIPGVNINYCAILSHELSREGRYYSVEAVSGDGSPVKLQLDNSRDFLNAEGSLDDFFKLTEHGSTVVRLKDNQTTMGGLSAINLFSRAADLGEHDNKLNVQSAKGCGAISFGTWFKFPQSPDMSISMERNFDFVKHTKSMSGKSYSTVSNNGASFGHNEQPFGLYNYAGKTNYNGENDALYDGLFNRNHHDLHKYKRVGRRQWELSWSQLGAKDVFHAYESGTIDDWTRVSNIVDNGGETIINWSSIPVLETNAVMKLFTMTHAGRLPFIFQPDSDDNTPNGFCLAKVNMNSFSVEQESFERYSFSLEIQEIW